MLRLLQQPGGYERVLAVLKPTPHRVLPVPTAAQLLTLLRQPNGEAATVELFNRREEAIRLEREDPFRYAMVLKPWRDASLLLNDCMLLAVFGGNRAGKTEYGAWKGVNVMVDKPGAEVLWLHESEQSSIDVQQVAVHKYIPQEWQVVKKGTFTNVSWTRKNGFSENKFVFPNGSVGKFGSYKQDIGDYEGLEYDLIVADENLPLAWLKTLLIRLATRAGKFIWSFTPLHGITPAGKEIVEGAVTLESREVDPDVLDVTARHVEDCPIGHMPYIQRSTFGDCRIIYFHSDLNPYGGFETLKKLLLTMEPEDRKRRGYGYARNTLLTLFPNFGLPHIFEPGKMPEHVSLYHFADPAGARNMFMLWVAVDARGNHFVYREWPDVARYGEWAVPSEDGHRWDGMMGPGQPTLGFGVLEYKRLILEAEGNRWDDGWQYCGEKVETRYMDPRSGAAQAIVVSEGGSSLFERMREEQENDKKLLEGPLMDFQPALGLREDEGIRCIQDLLSYDRRQPVTALVNEPHLFVARNCLNVIWALKNYTAHDGEKAACKDPIDCLRYMATANLQYLNPNRPRSWPGGSY